MMKIPWLGAALGVLVLGGAAEARTEAQRADPAVSEMQRERLNPAVPSVPQQDRNAAMADAMRDPQSWLDQAAAAVRKSQFGAAIELLERSETRMLSRSTLASMADQPMLDARVAHISAARTASHARDGATALREIALARGAS